MTNKEPKRNKPFDSFSRANMWLIAAGYCRLYNPRNEWTKAWHKLYRKIALICVYIYSLQHIIYFVQIVVYRDNEKTAEEYNAKLIETVIITIPVTILSLKVSTMYFGTKRIDKLVELMDDPIFAANNEQDEIYLEKNKKATYFLSNAVTASVSVVAIFWILDPIYKRTQDPNTVVPSYFPFKTDTWPKFLLANCLDTYGVLLWVALAQLNIDCVIATYYAQARVQLQIINYNLQHLFDSDRQARGNRRFEFLDISDKSVQERFVYYVKRFERVCWYTNEVTSIFSPIISSQFFVTSFTSCLAIFQMSSTDTFTVTFAFSFGYYIVTQSEIFMYCYYGGLIEHESRLLLDSVYLGEWLSVSPKFRRQLLIAMSRWIKPITPKVSGIVPLSLATFVSITRTAYSLFTVLKSKNNKGSGERTLAF